MKIILVIFWPISLTKTGHFPLELTTTPRVPLKIQLSVFPAQLSNSVSCSHVNKDITWKCWDWIHTVYLQWSLTGLKSIWAANKKNETFAWRENCCQVTPWKIEWSTQHKYTFKSTEWKGCFQQNMECSTSLPLDFKYLNLLWGPLLRAVDGCCGLCPQAEEAARSEDWDLWATGRWCSASFLVKWTRWWDAGHAT